MQHPTETTAEAARCPLPRLQDYAGMLRDAGFDGVAAFDRTEQVGCLFGMAQS